MVPEARLELARLERRGILNPLCLPIPPLGQIGAFCSPLNQEKCGQIFACFRGKL